MRGKFFVDEKRKYSGRNREEGTQDIDQEDIDQTQKKPNHRKVKAELLQYIREETCEIREELHSNGYQDIAAPADESEVNVTDDESHADSMSEGSTADSYSASDDESNADETHEYTTTVSNSASVHP